MSRTLMIQIRIWTLTSRFNLLDISHVFMSDPNLFLIWHWLTIFGTWVYHHEKRFDHVHSCCRFNVNLWSQGQIYCLLSCLHVRPVTSVSFAIDIPYMYLSHGSITIRGFVKYMHDPDTTLTFDLKVQFLGFMTCLCVQASAF